MTIKEAIEQLSACPDPENHRVCAIDPDTKRIVDVTAISAEDAFKDEPYVAIFSTFVPLPKVTRVYDEGEIIHEWRIDNTIHQKVSMGGGGWIIITTKL